MKDLREGRHVSKCGVRKTIMTVWQMMDWRGIRLEAGEKVRDCFNK